MSKKENKNLLLNVCNIAIEAGIIINEFFNRKNDIFYKKDKSPVTKADLASNSLIIHKLKNDLDFL